MHNVEEGMTSQKKLSLEEVEMEEAEVKAAS